MKKVEIRYQVLPETKQQIQELADHTHRTPAGVIDAAIQQFYLTTMKKEASNEN